MTPQHVISQLLQSDTKYPKNLDLLKKIIITTYLGRFRVNSLAPDNKIPLGNYLFDEERVMFDYTRLSEDKRALFFKWLLEPHEQEKEYAYLSSVYVNEYRGFTAEVALSWWGRLISRFENRRSEHWKITDLSLSINYQLTGIEMCHGQNGTLIGFNQFLVPPSGAKYKDPNDPQREPLGNIKRVFITDNLVDQVMKMNIKNINYESVCKSPHPQSIDVNNLNARHEEMHGYRKMQKFLDLKPWYIRLWRWFLSFFIAEESIKKEEPIKNERTLKNATAVDNSLTLLHEHKNIKIFQRDLTKEILVREKRPDITNLVLCGGGGKIFAHVGAWKALWEAKIRPVNFAGSSAGAIMCLLCYLGYSPDEITELFKYFKREHLVSLDIDRNGLSDPNAIKTSLDYAIALRIKQITTKYKIPYPHGKITFATLDSLKQQCPGCGIGNELIVTATNKRLRQTKYFSLAKTPLKEVSEVVKTSASIPPFFRSTIIDGEEHNDGGILSNFPTEAFSDDHSTLLESEYGNHLGVFAVQFDNGTERTAVDKLERVYRENFILNWIYSLLTGVSDPASGWEQDRMKLRKYASQSIVVNVDNISTSSFTVDEESRNKTIQNGYEATKSYLDVRYEKGADGKYVNQEFMYSTFSSLGDLLSYCCYRGDSYWFEVVNNLIVQSSLPNRTALMKQSIELRHLYFNSASTPEEKPKTVHNPVTFFGNDILHEQSGTNKENHNILLAIFPIFLKLSSELIKNSADKKNLEAARHSLSLDSPFRCLDYLNKLKDTNIIVSIFMHLLKLLKEKPSEQVYNSLQDLNIVLSSNIDLSKSEYYGKWDLTFPQCLRVLKLFKNNQQSSAMHLFEGLLQKVEPMQSIKKGRYYEDFSDGSDDENSFDFSSTSISA